MNFTQQYGENRQGFQRDKFYYAVWQLLLYFYKEFPSKTVSVLRCRIFRVRLKVYKNSYHRSSCYDISSVVVIVAMCQRRTIRSACCLPNRRVATGYS